MYLLATLAAEVGQPVLPLSRRCFPPITPHAHYAGVNSRGHPRLGLEGEIDLTSARRTGGPGISRSLVFSVVKNASERLLAWLSGSQLHRAEAQASLSGGLDGGEHPHASIDIASRLRHDTTQPDAFHHLFEIQRQTGFCSAPPRYVPHPHLRGPSESGAHFLGAGTKQAQKLPPTTHGPLDLRPFSFGLTGPTIFRGHRRVPSSECRPPSNCDCAGYSSIVGCLLCVLANDEARPCRMRCGIRHRSDRASSLRRRQVFDGHPDEYYSSSPLGLD
ncbi:hypothetical protein FB451DRAFT_1396683 [Mycena latifolia]|nr:hypothetical protein FB451DRAFT_1396683 [Mycena latifolia]